LKNNDILIFLRHPHPVLGHSRGRDIVNHSNGDLQLASQQGLQSHATIAQRGRELGHPVIGHDAGNSHSNAGNVVPAIGGNKLLNLRHQSGTARVIQRCWVGTHL
jgi:hypothetical protein